MVPFKDIYLIMRFGVFNKFGAMNSKPVFAAFENAIRRKGWEVSYHDTNADVAVIWSVLWQGRMASNQKIWEHFHRKNKPVIVLEVGALDRGNLWKVALNGINGAGYFGSENNGPERRKKLNLSLKPWKQANTIYICGQHPNSQQWKGMPSIRRWFDEVIAEIRKKTDRNIVVRPHPRSPMMYTSYHVNVIVEYPKHLRETYDSFDFDEALQNAWAVVNHNSNVGPVAVLNGVPAFVGIDSYAAPVASFDLSRIEDPFMPDREQWANDLAYTEWTLEEIASGEPLDRLSSKIIV